MLRTTFLSLFFIFSCGVVSAQNTGTVSGMITDSLDRPLEGATVLLVTGEKDVPVKSALSDVNGTFVLGKIKPGSYKLIISMTGFTQHRSMPLILNEEKNNINADKIKLFPLPKNLEGITVTSQRPAVERKIDRTIVNADQMVTAAGSTAMDVLEKSPGVSVDNNGVISLQGRNGVVIFIDDKPTYLGGADLENYLRSLPASSVD